MPKLAEVDRGLAHLQTRSRWEMLREESRHSGRKAFIYRALQDPCGYCDAYKAGGFVEPYVPKVLCAACPIFKHYGCACYQVDQYRVLASEVRNGREDTWREYAVKLCNFVLGELEQIHED